MKLQRLSHYKNGARYLLGALCGLLLVTQLVIVWCYAPNFWALSLTSGFLGAALLIRQNANKLQAKWNAQRLTEAALRQELDSVAIQVTQVAQLTAESESIASEVAAARSSQQQQQRELQIVRETLMTCEEVLNVQQAQLQLTLTTTQAAALEILTHITEIDGTVNQMIERFSTKLLQSREEMSGLMDGAQKNSYAVMEELTRSIERRSLQAREEHRRFTAISAEVSSLSQQAKGIGEIAIAARILSLNANIEASRANLEHNGFRVVAQEMTRLANEVAVIAAQLDERLMKVAAAIGIRLETSVAENLQTTEDNAKSLESIAAQLAGICGVYEQLQSKHVLFLSESTSTNEHLATKMMQLMGSMQFQDILRQQLEHVVTALVQVSQHLTLIREAEGQTPEVFEATQKILAELAQTYIMESQRQVHAEAIHEKYADSKVGLIELF